MTVPVYNMTDTWNNALTVFSAIKMTVTVTAADNQSNFLSFFNGATEKFRMTAGVGGQYMSIQHPAGESLQVLTIGGSSGGSVTSTTFETTGSTSGFGVNLASLGFGGINMAGSTSLISYDGTSGIVGLRNGSNPQTFRVYNTHDGSLPPTNYERGVFDWTTTSNVLTIGAQAGGTGTLRSVTVIGNTLTLDGSAASLVDIKSGFGGAGVSCRFSSNGYNFPSSAVMAWASTTTVTVTNDTSFSRYGAGILGLSAYGTTSPAGFQVYNTVDSFNSPTNYERGSFDWTTNANWLTIGTQAGGTGTARGIFYIAAGGQRHLFSNIGAGGPTGSGLFTIDSSGVALGNGAVYAISSGNDPTTARDCALGRSAPKVMGFNDAGGGTNGWMQWAGQARVTSIFSKTSDTSLANVTGLTATLQAGRTYTFEAVLLCTTGASAGGVKVALGGTATVTDLRADGFGIDGTTVIAGTQVTTLTTIIANTNAGTTPKIQIWGTITVNAAGTLTIQFAQNASSGTASSVNRGSYMLVYDMP